MQPTFRLWFPKPSTAAAFSFYGAVATSDGRITFRHQRVERQFMFLDVRIAFLACYVDHGIEFDDASAFFKHVKVGAVICLPTHQAGHPDIVIGLDVFQGLEFIDRAAKIRIRFVQLFLFAVLVLVCVRLYVFDLEMIKAFQIIPVQQGFLEMEAGVDEKNNLLRPDARNDMQKIRGRCGKGRCDQDFFRREIRVKPVQAFFKTERVVQIIQFENGLLAQASAVADRLGFGFLLGCGCHSVEQISAAYSAVDLEQALKIATSSAESKG
jgi:hypothetical protein